MRGISLMVDVILGICIIAVLWEIKNLLVRKKEYNPLSNRIEFYKHIDDIDWTDCEEDREKLIEIVDKLRQDSYEAGLKDREQYSKQSR